MAEQPEPPLTLADLDRLNAIVERGQQIAFHLAALRRLAPSDPVISLKGYEAGDSSAMGSLARKAAGIELPPGVQIRPDGG